jgi:hypothetical protein
LNIPSTGSPEARTATAAPWLDRIQLAHSGEDVVATINAFLASQDYAALARLPASCAPPRSVDSMESINAFAYDLLRAKLDAPAGTAAALERLASVFARASVRVAQLEAYGSATARRQRVLP